MAFYGEGAKQRDDWKVLRGNGKPVTLPFAMEAQGKQYSDPSVAVQKKVTRSTRSLLRHIQVSSDGGSVNTSLRERMVM